MSHHFGLSAPPKPTRTVLQHGAGAIVVRRFEGQLQVCLVLNAKDRDWSFPHGRTERGESLLACAHRELREEAGLVAQELRSLDTTRYKTPRGKPHATRYWLMVLKEDLGGPQGREQLGRRWCGVDEALELLTWAHDKDLLRGADLS